MKEDSKKRAYSPLELMLKWDYHCIKEGDYESCILLNEEQTYREAFDDEEQAMRDILNSHEPSFKRNDGFLVPIFLKQRYIGILYVPEDDIGKYIDLDLIGLG